MLASTVQSLGIWNWWILAGILLALELLAPTFFFLWFGAAALVVGVMLLFFDISWQLQVSAFAALSVIFLAVSKLVFKRDRGVSDQLLNQRAERLLNRAFRTADGISDGQGRIRVDDTVWRVRGPDCAPGSMVKVTGIDGTVLLVEPVA